MIKKISNWYSNGGNITLARIAYVFYCIWTILEALGMLITYIVLASEYFIETWLCIVLIVGSIPIVTILNCVVLGFMLGHIKWLERIKLEPAPIEEEYDENNEEDEYGELNNSSNSKQSMTDLPVTEKYNIEDVEIDGPIIKLGNRSFRMTLISDVHFKKDNIDLIAFGAKYKIFFENKKQGYSLYKTILDNYKKI